MSIQPGDFVHTLGDAHVYINHIQPLEVQVGNLDFIYLFIMFLIPATSSPTASLLTPTDAERNPTVPQTKDPEESGEHRRLPGGGL